MKSAHESAQMEHEYRIWNTQDSPQPLRQFVFYSCQFVGILRFERYIPSTHSAQARDQIGDSLSR